MNVQEVEAKMVTRINGLEDQEARLQEWLECLRKLDGIAAQWQSESIEEVVVETTPAETQNVDENLTVVDEFEAVRQVRKEVHEEHVAFETQSQMAEDPFDQLRRKLARESTRKLRPVFNSGLLFGANA